MGELSFNTLTGLSEGGSQKGDIGNQNSWLQFDLKADAFAWNAKYGSLH